MCKTPKNEPELANISTEAGPKWTCLRCTAINEDGDTFCVACDNMRGVWVCDACDAIYLSDQDSCDLCGKILERPPDAEPPEPEPQEELTPKFEEVPDSPKFVAPLEEIQEVPSPSNPNNWMCPFCHTENPQKRKACIDCLKRRPDLPRSPTPTRMHVKSLTTVEDIRKSPSPARSAGSAASPITPSKDSSPSSAKEPVSPLRRAITARSSMPASTVEWWCRECEIYNPPKRKACSECYKSKARVCSG